MNPETEREIAPNDGWSLVNLSVFLEVEVLLSDVRIL